MGLPFKLGLAALIAFLLIWCTAIPLGVPREWTWNRSPLAPDIVLSLVPAVIWGAIFCIVGWMGSTRIEHGSRWERVAWLTSLFAVSFGLIGGLQEAAPPEYRFAKVAWVLYFPGASGYFTEAKKVQDTQEFLSHYEQELKKGDVLHQGTHPPGLIVGYRGLMWLVSQSPGLRKVLLTTQPADLQEAFRVIAVNSARSPTPLIEADRCVLWLAALIMQACAAATVIPLYFLLRLHVDRVTSWQLATFWPVVPAVAVFLPKSDTCFPFLGCAVLALWLHGLRKGSVILAFLAGCLFWLGMTLSLAVLPVAFLSGLLTVWYLWACSPDERIPHGTARLSWGLVAGLTGFVLLTHYVRFVLQCNLITVWEWNYHNHAGFYAQFPRTYWKWLLVNPLELAIAAGLPLIFIALSSLPLIRRQPRSASAGPFWCSLATWLILWLTGKNMGEAARLWIFLMPWIIWSAAIGWQSLISKTSSLTASRLRWLLCWLFQFATAVIVVSRITGFQNFR